MKAQQDNSEQRRMIYGVQMVLSTQETEPGLTGKAHGDQAVIGPPGNKGGRGCHATASGGGPKRLGIGAYSAEAPNEFGLGFRDRSLRRSIRCEAYMPAESGGAPRGGNLGAPGGRKGVAVGEESLAIDMRTGKSNTPVFAHKSGSFCLVIPLNPPSAYGYSNTPPSRFRREAALGKAVR